MYSPRFQDDSTFEAVRSQAQRRKKQTFNPEKLSGAGYSTSNIQFRKEICVNPRDSRVVVHFGSPTDQNGKRDKNDQSKSGEEAYSASTKSRL
jgi:hypothetical protein